MSTSRTVRNILTHARVNVVTVDAWSWAELAVYVGSWAVLLPPVWWLAVRAVDREWFPQHPSARARARQSGLVVLATVVVDLIRAAAVSRNGNDWRVWAVALVVAAEGSVAFRWADRRLRTARRLVAELADRR